MEIEIVKRKPMELKSENWNSPYMDLLGDFQTRENEL